MTRLPIPGQDDGTWGDILNAYLSVSLASDGTLNPNVVGSSQLANNAVTNAQLDGSTQAILASVANKYVKPGGGIPGSDIATGTITASNLSGSVQNNLTSASTAVQLGGDLGGSNTVPTVAKLQGTTLNGSSPADGQVLTYSTGASAWVPGTPSTTTVNDATTSSKGIVELTGDLGGTASSPTIVSTHLSSALPFNQGGTGSTTQNFVDLTTGQSVGGVKTFTSAPVVPSSSFPESAVTNLTTDLSAKVTKAGDTMTGKLTVPSFQVTGGSPTSGQVLTADSSGNAAWGTPVAGAQALAATAIKTSAYGAAAGDFVPVDTTSGAVTITLPTAPADKTRVGVKLITQALTNAVTIAAGGSDVFNKVSGSTSLTLSLLNQGMLLQYTASTGIWYVQSDDLALSQLDGRYPLTTDPRLSDTRTPTAGSVTVATLASDTLSLIKNPLNFVKKGSAVYWEGQGTTTALSLTNGLLRLSPLVFPNRPIDQFGIEITASGGSGAVGRLLIFSDDGTTYPGALFYDSGAVFNLAAAPAVQYQTVSPTISPNGLMWIGFVEQGSPASDATIRGCVVVGFSSLGHPSAAAANAQIAGYATASGAVTGAGPSNFATSFPFSSIGVTANPPRIYGRFSG